MSDADSSLPSSSIIPSVPSSNFYGFSSPSSVSSTPSFASPSSSSAPSSYPSSPSPTSLSNATHSRGFSSHRYSSVDKDK
jgi:hypothetical protein